MANNDLTDEVPPARLARRRSYTVEVPGFGRVTYTRGEMLPPRHFQHVPPQHRMWFETEEGEDGDSPDEDTE